MKNRAKISPLIAIASLGMVGFLSSTASVADSPPAGKEHESIDQQVAGLEDSGGNQEVTP